MKTVGFKDSFDGIYIIELKDNDTIPLWTSGMSVMSQEEIEKIRKQEKTSEQLAEEYRSKRDALLSECDWTQVADAPVDQAAWKVYRQALRDIPEQKNFPANIVWPNKPE